MFFLKKPSLVRYVNFKTEIVTAWVLLLSSVLYCYGGIIKQIMTNPTGDRDTIWLSGFRVSEKKAYHPSLCLRPQTIFQDAPESLESNSITCHLLDIIICTIMYPYVMLQPLKSLFFLVYSLIIIIIMDKGWY